MSRLDFAFHQSKNQLWPDQTLLPSQNWYFQPIKFFDLGQNFRNQTWWDTRFRIPFNKYVHRVQWVNSSLVQLQKRYELINLQNGSSLRDENRKVDEIIKASRASLGQVKKESSSENDKQSLDPNDWNSYLTVEETEKRDQNTMQEISAVRQEGKENREKLDQVIGGHGQKTGKIHPKFSEQDIEMTNMMLKMFKNSLTDMSRFQLDERFGFPYFSDLNGNGQGSQSVLFNYQEGQTGQYTCGNPSIGLVDQHSNQVHNIYPTSNNNNRNRSPPGYTNLQNPLLGGKGDAETFISKNMEDMSRKMEEEFDQMEKYMASFFNGNAGGFPIDMQNKQLANNFSSNFSSTRTSYKSYYDKETKREVQIEESVIEDNRGVRTIRKKNGEIIYDEFKPKK